MKYKYNIGDVITLNSTTFGKVGIILNKPGHNATSYDVAYTILVCGHLEPVAFWEEEIEGIIE